MFEKKGRQILFPTLLPYNKPPNLWGLGAMFDLIILFILYYNVLQNYTTK